MKIKKSQVRPPAWAPFLYKASKLRHIGLKAVPVLSTGTRFTGLGERYLFVSQLLCVRIIDRCEICQTIATNFNFLGREWPKKYNNSLHMNYFETAQL